MTSASSVIASSLVTSPRAACRTCKTTGDEPSPHPPSRGIETPGHMQDWRLLADDIDETSAVESFGGEVGEILADGHTATTLSSR